MKRCAALTRDGQRCRRDATDGFDYCYSHNPRLAEERSKNAKKAGLAGGRGRPGQRSSAEQGPSEELTAAKREIAATIEAVRDGTLDRGTGAVIGNLLNVLLRSLDLQRRWHEADTLEQRLSALEEQAHAAQSQARSKRYA